MYVKILAALLFCFSVAVFVATLTTRSAGTGGVQTGAVTQVVEDPTTLKARVKKEKAKGATKVTFASPVPIYAETSGLDEAFSTYLVVIAKPVEAKTFMLSPHKLTTFQKFEIIERLATPANTDCCGPQASDFPAELPSPGVNEIYLRMNGGKALIDGVEVTQQSEFPFKDSEQYLLFLLPDSTGVIGTVPLGPYGIFRVKGDDVESILNSPHTLDTEFKTKFGKSLSRLKIARAEQHKDK